MANVQISKELFFEIVKYHLLDIQDNQDFIKSELSTKIDKMANHELYSKQFNKDLTPEQQQQARLEYLDKIGIHKDFRW